MVECDPCIHYAHIYQPPKDVLPPFEGTSSVGMGDIDILWSRLLPNPLSRLLHLSRYINNSLNDFKTIKSTLIVH